VTHVEFRGVIVPLTTPFTADEEIDRQAFARQIDWMLAEGVNGFVVGGSTGEGYALDDGEILELSKLALDVVAGRVPVMASIMVDSTRAAVKRAKQLAELPLSGLQIAPPHYIFTPHDDGLFAFYAAVGAASPLPLILYNVISWANVGPEVAARILDGVPTAHGVKQSDKDLGRFADLVLAVGPEQVFGAIDGSLMSCYDLGIAGSIAAIASATPRASVALWQAVQRGNRARALELNAALGRFWQHLSGNNLPARVKAAQTAQGIAAGQPRAPMSPLTAIEATALAAAFQELAQITDR
jgi:4-hydroxy-tetrahydrodipicolinate synthase